jgi:hypothetical protein
MPILRTRNQINVKLNSLSKSWKNRLSVKHRKARKLKRASLQMFRKKLRRQRSLTRGKKLLMTKRCLTTQQILI